MVKKTSKKKETGTELKSSSGELTEQAMMDFEADAGKGLEQADKDSFAIPFVTILQSNSPQVEDELEGAKPGLFINTVTNEMAKEIQLIPVLFQRRFLRWAPRESGGGFKGEYTAAEVEQLIESGEAERADEGVGIEIEDDILRDTRHHFCLVRFPSGSWTPALIAMSSTQIKKSKRLNAMCNNFRLEGANGPFNPPSFARIYRATTVKESNNKGSWYGFAIEADSHEGNPKAVVSDRNIYEEAKEFHRQITEGKVEYDAEVAAEAAGEGAEDDGKF